MISHSTMIIITILIGFNFCVSDIFKDKDTDNTQTATFTMDEWIESTIYS